MNKILILIFIANLGLVNAQVAFGKTSVDGSAVVDFVENSNKGLILPWVEDLTKIEHSAATLLYDTKNKKVIWFDGTTWKDLSIRPGAADLTETATYDENEKVTGSAVIIGDPGTASVGVLSLNKEGHALILPKNVMPWENIKNPEPGTITYDTVNNLVCIFNGVEWTFWGK